MALVITDLEWYYTVKTGAAGNSTASSGPASLGKYISTTIAPITLNNLFDIVSGDENAAGNVEYRCIALRNKHATLTLYGCVIWVSAEVAGGTSVAIAIDSAAASPIGQAGAQGDDIADEDTAPDAVGAFSTPTSKATGLSIGDLAPGYCRFVWIKRTAAATGPVDADGMTLDWAGDTAA